MKIQTFSIVIGTRACNAGCPFCVSSMTGFAELPKNRAINQEHLKKACRLAQLSGTTTVLFTGKGEPTLYPDEITAYLDALAPYEFPFIELQTNALSIGRLARGTEPDTKLTEAHLEAWRERGLNTVAISTVGLEGLLNGAVYDEDYPRIERTVAYLRQYGFTVRLCVMMMHGRAHMGQEGSKGVNSPKTLAPVIEWCRKNDVAQLKVSPLRKPKKTEDSEASQFVERCGVSEKEIRAVSAWLKKTGTPLMHLMHGAAIYDVGGQNVCLADCLTVDAKSDDIRTLIYYSNGRLTYDWQYDGATLLSGLPDWKKEEDDKVHLSVAK